MSRTIRRRHANYEYDWVLRDFFVCDYGYFSVYHIDPKSHEGKKLVSVFHSDNQETMHMVPSWFRRSLNRKHRCINRKIMFRFAREGCLEDGPILTPYKKDARHLWW